MLKKQKRINSGWDISNTKWQATAWSKHLIFCKLLTKAAEISTRNLPILPSVHLTLVGHPTLSETLLFSGVWGLETFRLRDWGQPWFDREFRVCVSSPCLSSDSPKCRNTPTGDYCGPRMEGELLAWTDVKMGAYSQAVSWPFTQSAGYLSHYSLKKRLQDFTSGRITAWRDAVFISICLHSIKSGYNFCGISRTLLVEKYLPKPRESLNACR